MLIRADDLTRLVHDIFHAEGCSEAESGRIALYLVRANLTGHDSHGVIRVPRYVAWERSGEFVKNQTAEVVTENDSFAVVDGRFGFGQSIGPEAVQVGMRKAAKSGAAVVALKSSGHLGRIGEWAEMAAEAGLVSVHFVNVAGSQLVAPFGGVDRRISTAPFSIGFPMRGAEPVILDFATSAVAEGKVLVAARGGKKLPAGQPDRAGRPAHAPTRTRSTAITTTRAPPTPATAKARSAPSASTRARASPSCASSSPAPSPARAAPDRDSRVSANGMLSFYMAPSFFGTDEAYTAEAQRYIEFFKSSRPASAGGEVLVPGEPERRSKAERLKNGVPLPDDAWRAICATAREVGVDPDRYPVLQR